MGRRKSFLPLRLPGDSARWKEAVDWCEAEGIPVTRRSSYQLKVGNLNFYPDGGSMNYDACPRLPQEGLPAFEELVEELLRKGEVVKIAVALSLE
jgi:hypothetical protein